MSTVIKAKRAAERLDSTNGWVVVLSVLGSLGLVVVGLISFGDPGGPVYLALGIAGVVWSIFLYQITEAFTQHVLVNTEILMELEKSNGYK